MSRPFCVLFFGLHHLCVPCVEVESVHDFYHLLSTSHSVTCTPPGTHPAGASRRTVRRPCGFIGLYGLPVSTSPRSLSAKFGQWFSRLICSRVQCGSSPFGWFEHLKSSASKTESAIAAVLFHSSSPPYGLTPSPSSGCSSRQSNGSTQSMHSLQPITS